MIAGSVWVIIVLEILETTLYMLFKMHKVVYKKLVVVALNVVAIFLLASYYLCLKRSVHSIREEILVRVLMCKTSIVIISSVFSFINGASSISYIVYIVLFSPHMSYVYVSMNISNRTSGDACLVVCLTRSYGWKSTCLPQKIMVEKKKGVV